MLSCTTAADYSHGAGWQFIVSCHSERW